MGGIQLGTGGIDGNENLVVKQTAGLLEAAQDLSKTPVKERDTKMTSNSNGSHPKPEKTDLGSGSGDAIGGNALAPAFSAPRLANFSPLLPHSTLRHQSGQRPSFLASDFSDRPSFQSEFLDPTDGHSTAMTIPSNDNSVALVNTKPTAKFNPSAALTTGLKRSASTSIDVDPTSADKSTPAKRHRTQDEETSLIPAPPTTVSSLRPSQPKRRVPLDQILSAVDKCLAPKAFLNNIVVNTIIGRLESQHVGVMDSLSLLTTASRPRLRRLVETKATILWPSCDEQPKHWRLYRWSAPATLELFDPYTGLEDNTTGPVEEAFASAVNKDKVLAIEAQVRS